MPKAGGDFFWSVCEAPAFDMLREDEELGLRVLGQGDYNCQGGKRWRQKQKRHIVEVEIGRGVDTGGVREKTLGTLENTCVVGTVGINVWGISRSKTHI